MSITNGEKLNLERFGCTFRDRGGVFYIDWKGRRAAQASSASIFACLVRVRTTSGPIALLALEISAIRPLPIYCYFPFDLRKRAHRSYLVHLTKTGEIPLSFVTGKKIFKRRHQLGAYPRLRSAEIYAEVLQEFEAIEVNSYNFDNALLLMERHVRIPELVGRLFLEDTLSEISQKVEDAVKHTPSENLELARTCVHEAAEAFLPYYRDNRNNILQIVQGLRSGSTYVIDLHRMFFNDPEGSRNFVSDALAASLSTKELEALNKLVKFVVSLSEMFKDQPPKSTSTGPTPPIPDLPTGLVTLVQSMATTGISKDAASRFFELIGLKVGGRPGRPTIDYSREYDLKASHSWSDLAAQRLQENTDLRDEFGGRDFDSLTFEEQENLRNRIREGVKSYAERTDKPFPIERVAPKKRLPDPQENQ